MRISLLFVCLLLALAWQSTAQVKPEWKEVIGTWEGDSICTLPDSPCHDEHALYRIKPDKDDPDKLTLEGFKVVDKKPQFMGDLACKYAAENKVLTCSGNTPKRDIWTFQVGDATMDGTLTIGKEKTIYRKIALRKK